jgi:2-dehydropantoate 2-reductase
MFGATYIKPGEVTYNFPGDWIIGKPYMPNDPKVWGVESVLKKAFSVVVADQIMGMKWLKLFVNFNNCIPALIGKSMQETFSDLDFCRLSILLLREGVNIVQNAGIELVSLPQFPVDRIVGLSKMPVEQAAGIINKTLTTLSKEPLYGSILQSIMRKRTSEIDFINGEVALLASSISMESPLNRKVVNLVHQVENQGKFLDVKQVKQEFGLNSN